MNRKMFEKNKFQQNKNVNKSKQNRKKLEMIKLSER